MSLDVTEGLGHVKNHTLGKRSPYHLLVEVRKDSRPCLFMYISRFLVQKTCLGES